MLILETKGEEPDQDQVKHRYLAEWVQAVNTHGGFGRWDWAVAHHPGEIRDVLIRHGGGQPGACLEPRRSVWFDCRARQ